MTTQVQEVSGKRTWYEKLQVPQVKSGTYANDQYTNPDLVPMDKTRRTWGIGAFITYWMTGGFAIYNYTTGASLIAYGLSARQAIAACVISPIVLGAVCVLCGMMGARHHIGFVVAARSSWGIWGSYFCIALRVIPGLIWDGIEAYWGGQAVSTMIGTMSLRWANWSYLLASGTLELKDLIGFFIYYVVFLILMWMPPEKLKRPFFVSCVGFVGVVIGMLAWSLKQSGGSLGRYFDKDYKTEYRGGSSGWAFAIGMTAVLGNCGVVVLSQSDWCRFARTSRAPMVTQAIACPLFIFAICVLGIIITSASSVPLGEAIWQPYLLLRSIQTYHNDSASSRAAVFFASLACSFSQVCVNIILNSTSASMDISAYAPKYINIRRGAYIVAITGLATNPWQITTSAATFITVLSGFGNFYGCMSAVLIADYWIVRRRKLILADLYKADKSSVYFYTYGLNWRAFVAFFVGLIPTFPGYIRTCAHPELPINVWQKLSALGYLFGFIIATIVYTALCYACPVAGAGEGEDRHDEDTLVLPSAYDKTRPSQGPLSVDHASEVSSEKDLKAEEASA